jgi:hypothetical protein
MDITTIQILKISLEGDVATMIAEFENETDTKVESIFVITKDKQRAVKINVTI